jgi:hypothetical protein
MSYIPARTTTHSDALAIHSGGWLETRAQRRAAKEITRMRLRGAVVTAREVTRIDAVEEVSASALLAAAHVSAVEGALAQQTPHSRARLMHIADSSSVALSSIVARAGRGI